MLLYHGSNTVIEKINLAKGRPFKDFGKGFYLTTIEEQAVFMAKRTCRIFHGSPFVTKFEFDDETLKNSGLNVKKFDAPTTDWAMFVLNNRNRTFMDFTDENSNHDNKYDIVIGAVANDDIVLLFRDFSNGRIDMNALANGMKYKKLSNQYSFHTDKAVSLLTKKEAKSYE